MKAKLVPVYIKGIPPKAKLAPETKARKAAKTFDAIPFKKAWPKIMQYMIEYPDETYAQLWKKFAPILDDVFTQRGFEKKLENAGMTKRALNAGLSVTEQVKVAVKTFGDLKKERAEKHMTRIHEKLDEIHNVVGSIVVEEKNVGRVLGLVGELQKQGRIAYDIGEENRGDQKVTNLAVMIGFQPTEKKATVVEV